MGPKGIILFKYFLLQLFWLMRIVLEEKSSEPGNSYFFLKISIYDVDFDLRHEMILLTLRF